MNGSRAWFEKDFYKVLGVSESAGTDEIKRAYRKLARTYHPDRNPGDRQAEERMKEISEASDVLSDPKKRAEYDQMRRMAAGGFHRFGPAGVRFEDLGFDLGDVFGGDVFGGIFGGRRARGPGRGEDLETEVRVSFEDSIEGATVAVRVSRDAACASCGGSGVEPGSRVESCASCGGSGTTGENQGLFSFVRPCNRCGGSGRIVTAPCRACGGRGSELRAEEIKVRVPAGVSDGARIRARGRGAAGPRGGPAGDLYVVVRVAPHPLFGRRNSDLILTLPITFPEAALGAKVKVPTLDGAVTLKIPAGTQPGRTFRIKGRGAPRARGGGRGDLLVTVQVAVPEKMSSKERELLERFAEAHSTSPRAHLGA